MCYKVKLCQKTILKTLYIYIILQYACQSSCIFLVRSTGTFKIITIDFSAVLSGNILYVLGPFQLQRLNKLHRKYTPIRTSQQKWTSADMELRNYPKPKYLSSWLPDRNSYFSSYKVWKNNYGIQLFKFSIQKILIKIAKNGGWLLWGIA